MYKIVNTELSESRISEIQDKISEKAAKATSRLEHSGDHSICFIAAEDRQTDGQEEKNGNIKRNLTDNYKTLKNRIKICRVIFVNRKLGKFLCYPQNIKSNLMVKLLAEKILCKVNVQDNGKFNGKIKLKVQLVRVTKNFLNLHNIEY